MNPTTIRPILLASNVKPIIDITDRLPKHPNGGWEVMPLKRYDGSTRSGLRMFEEVTHISVHHTATEGGTPEGHAKFHIRKNGGGIAYHIYIKGDQSYQVNDLLALTWHTQSRNYHSVGISVEGNFTKRNLTDDERNNLYASILAVMNIFSIPLTNVLGHREFDKQATSCPGFDMNKIRTDLAAIIEQQQYIESPANLNAELNATTLRYNDLWSKFANKDGKWSKEIQAEAERKLSVVNVELRKQGWMN